MKFLLQIVMSVTLAACTPVKFKGGGGQPKPVQSPKSENAKPTKPKTGGKFSVNCSPEGVAKHTYKIDSDDIKATRITLEFCGQPPVTEPIKPVNVQFVVDVSGSMLVTDPYVQNSCGRQRAILDAVVTRLIAIDKNHIRVGLMNFSESAQVTVPVVSLADFRKQVASKFLCLHTPWQTNYEDAFLTASSTLRELDGQTIMYFISDGLPTLDNTGKKGESTLSESQYNQRVQQKGWQAADKLRQDITDLTINAVFLKGASDEAIIYGASELGVNPVQYLSRITGDSSRVRTAENAGQLAEAIMTFEDPKPIVVLDKSLVVKVDDRVLDASLVQDKENPYKWSVDFELENLEKLSKRTSIRAEVELSSGEKRSTEIEIQIE